ncbi:uncharacterized protein [Diadema antillarum]|uniref:uncharacterized protein n=1 Tax=Diadema antillarum TaxID=105358 RepID=UPI003A872832
MKRPGLTLAAAVLLLAASGCQAQPYADTGHTSMSGITCPMDIVVTLPSSTSSAFISFEPPTFDESAYVLHNQTHTSGQAFHVGVTTVTYTFFDANGNVLRCSFNITILQDGSPCSSSPCQNGGLCTGIGDSYTCTCAAGYVGFNCEIRLLANTMGCALPGKTPIRVHVSLAIGASTVRVPSRVIVTLNLVLMEVPVGTKATAAGTVIVLLDTMEHRVNIQTDRYMETDMREG